MKLALLSVWLALPIFAQVAPGVVDCLLTIESPKITKKLYGKAPIATGTVRCKNYTQSTLQIAPEDIYIAMSTVPSMNATDATALLTQAYGAQPVQTWVRIASAALMGIGFATGTGGFVNLSARTLGYMMGGATVANEFVVPIFTANKTPLTTLLSNNLDSVGVTTLATGQSMTRKVYIEPPPKGSSLPPTVHFQFDPATPSLMAPQPQPVPMMVKPRELHAELDPVVDQVIDNWMAEVSYVEHLQMAKNIEAGVWVTPNRTEVAIQRMIEYDRTHELWRYESTNSLEK